MKKLLVAMLCAACGGDVGEMGVAGEQGTVGPQGPQGEQGPPGPQGIVGLKGDRGLDGPQGNQGPQGDQGIQGQVGDTGATGAQGIQGIQGIQGNVGATGPQGNDGDPGPNLYLFNSDGLQLGYPVTIDRGTSHEAAFYATQDNPPASFPQGRIVSGQPVSGIFYSGFSCDGNAYIAAIQSSANFDALYVLTTTNELWDTSGTINTRAVNSVWYGNGCAGSGGTMSAFDATSTTYTIDLSPPWTVASF